MSALPSSAFRTVLLARNDAQAVLMFLSSRPAAGTDLFCAVVEPQGRGLTHAHLARDLGRRELFELKEVVAGTLAGALRPATPETAQQLLARGVLASRLGGGDTPATLHQACDLTGDLAELEVADAYGCAGCPRALDTDTQLALARGRSPGSGPLYCAACGGFVASPQVPPWLARVELMLGAREPLRALRVAARAETHDAARPVDLARVRGWAQLALGNPVQAARHLSHAVALEPEELRTQWLLLAARAEVGEVQAVIAEAATLDRRSHRPRAASGPPRHPGELTRYCRAAAAQVG